MFSDEQRLLKNIAKRVLKETKLVPFEVAKHPVRMNEAIKDFKRTASESANSHYSVQIVGIWGTGESMKTTLAKQIYNNKYAIMDKSSLLLGVSDVVSTRKLHKKQKKLLEDLGLEGVSIKNIGGVKKILSSRLQPILDDLDNVDQSDAYCSVSGVHCSDYFENVICIRVSKSLYQKRTSEAIREENVVRKMLEFQNSECNNLLTRLQQVIRPSKRTLVLLVNVWSKSNLGDSVFEDRRLQIVTTFREVFAIPRSFCATHYELPMLRHENAISMHGEPHVALQNAKKRIPRRKPISHNRRGRILKFLRIITDSLDDVGRECFLDLVSFSAGKKICADALLDIWVYVWKMDRHDALFMVREHASRDLLNLTGNQGSQETIPYEGASELFLTQRSVVRDIACHFGCQGSPVHTKRLLMPRAERSLPGKWESFIDIPLNAQIVSLHTGSMSENDWYEMNLPETEALVLHFSATGYFLPPFLETMKKLKILIVCNLGSEKATIKSLDALSSLAQLRSVHLDCTCFSQTEQTSAKLGQTLYKLM